MIFDTHCHLPFCTDPVAATTQRAFAEGVTRVLTVGIDRDWSETARDTSREASQKYSRAVVSDSVTILYAAGLHPNSSGAFDQEWEPIAALCREADCTAVGETGLDYYWDRATPAQQKRSFAAHLALAIELDKPVIVHSRQAFPDTLDVLAAHPEARGVIHCFSEGVEEARRALELGFYLSFAGPLTYPNAADLRAAAAFAPGDRILVETDAPFLTPQAVRGQKNEPAFLVHTLRCLAELRNTSFEATAALTMKNGNRLFKQT